MYREKNQVTEDLPPACLPLVHAHASQCEAPRKAGAAEQDACLASTLPAAGSCRPRGWGAHWPIQTGRVA